MNSTVGQAFLNIAFGLYLILYLPQIHHNMRHKPFARMSLAMHLMLCLAYSCDLFYGIGRQMPWQYITVSFVGLCCLMIQHLQWCAYRYHETPQKGIKLFLQGAILMLIPLCVYLNFPESKWQMQLQAWIARCCFLLHFLPQIIQYQHQKFRRDAINIHYLGLSLCLSICDLVTAYCLHWDTANLLGSLISLCLKLILSAQMIRQTFWTLQD